jgi:hypothetical protein
VDFRIVEANSNRLMTVRSEWPEDLQWLLEEFKQTDEGRSTYSLHAPRFFVALDRKIIATSRGRESWTKTIVPTLDRLVGS